MIYLLAIFGILFGLFLLGVCIAIVGAVVYAGFAFAATLIDKVTGQ